jgi:hypothetical protein
MGPMEKITHRGDIQVRPHTAAPGWILRCQEPTERFQALVAVAVGPVELQRGRGRLVRQTRNASGT